MSRVLLLSFAAFLCSSSSNEEQQTFPIGTCEYNIFTSFGSPLSLKVFDGATCHRLCHHYNLTTGPDGTYLDRELNCTWGSDGPNRTHTCEDAELVVFSECQQSIPSRGPYDRTQCVCGDDEIVVCDSDYDSILGDNTAFVSRRPPLECESMNITDLESCIDVATYGGRDWYCNDSGTPCILKYERVGDYMMCTRKWREGDPTVICGDACAWTRSGASYTVGLGFGALGVAVAASIGTTLLL
eukprot:15364893-Ditylum_brightwellii.AAC.5